MKKLFAYFFLCLLFSGMALAEMSDEEKRAFIESLAEPSKEKRVFYRWQSEKVKNNLLSAGEMTPRLYDHFMSVSDDYAGTGMYVAEDIVSSSSFGDTLIRVELEPGYKYLDLRNQQVQEKLKSAGLNNEDVYRLNPRVAVTDIKEEKPYWVLKRREGVKFKDFIPQPAMIQSIEEGMLVLRRFKKPKERKAILAKTISLIKNVSDGVYVIRIIGDRLKLKEQKAIREKAISLIKTAEEGVDIFKIAGDHLKPKEQKAVLEKIIPLIQTAKEGQILHAMSGRYLKPKEQIAILEKAISLIKTAEEGMDIFEIVVNYIEPKEQKAVLEKTISLIQTKTEGKNLLAIAEKYLEPEDKKQITHKIRELFRLRCLKRQLSE